MSDAKTCCGFDYGFTNTSPPIFLNGKFIAACGAGFPTEELKKEHHDKYHNVFGERFQKLAEESGLLEQ